jgi:SAM-dependent methyltransferase
MTVDTITNFYDERSEHERLARGLGRLEAVRTLELLSKHLPPAPAVVYDVGGATGFYARWLGERGYAAHLLDPVSSHVEAARKHCAQLGSAQVGDARRLPWPDHSADAVLLMGPMYHLRDRADRVRALVEARRVLRPAGVLFGVIIPRWASTLIGLQRGWAFDDAYAAMMRDEITTGQHVRPKSWPKLFMNGYFHSMNDLRAEVRESGLGLQCSVAIEGPAWMAQEFDVSWDDLKKRERILELSRLAENDPDVIGASPHVAFTAAVGARR